MEERMYLGEAPTFRPTEKEFADPIKYIQSIRPIALEYGICKIVPPGPPERLQGPRRRGFKETVARHLDTINPHAFQFKTKLQKIHQLQSRYGPNETFVTDLQKFLEGRGTPMKSVPRVDGKELDLYKLFKIVMERGGNKKVRYSFLFSGLNYSSPTEFFPPNLTLLSLGKTVFNFSFPARLPKLSSG